MSIFNKNKSTQIFISYRREGGEALARLIHDRLSKKNYRVFLDVESLRSGQFNVQLYEKIDECSDFLLVLPENALERCVDPEDWVRLEIEQAINSNKNIIPVMMRNFKFPKELPPEIEKLRTYQGVGASMELFDAVMEKLTQMLISKPSNSFGTVKKFIIGFIAVLAIGSTTFALVNKDTTESAKQMSTQKVTAAWELYDKGDYKGVIKLCNEAIELNPDNALAYYARAYAYDDLEDYQQVINDCTKAIQLDDNPRLVATYNNRGEAYRKSGNYGKAIEDYDKAIELNSNYFKAYNNRGIVYDALGRYDLAVQDYNKALEINPSYEYAYTNRGLTYYHLNQYELALKDFDKALELNPNFISAKNSRELCLQAMGK